MQLIFDADNTEISIGDKNKMTTIDQGSKGEKFDAGFVTETNKEECHVVTVTNKEECHEVAKVEENYTKVPEEKESHLEVVEDVEKCPQVPKVDEKCLEVPEKEKCSETSKEENVQDNGTNLDDIQNECFSNQSQNGSTQENCVTDETATKTLELDASVDSGEATKMDTAESTESSVVLAEKNIETTKNISAPLETHSADEQPFEEVEMADTDGVEEEISPHNPDIKLNSDAIPTNDITEEAIEKTIEKTECVDIDQNNLAAPKSTYDVTNKPTVEENASNDRVLDDCMAGAGDSEIRELIEENPTGEDISECPVEVEQSNTKPDVIDEAGSLILKPELEKLVSEITVSEVENVNSEDNKVTNKTEILTNNEIDAMENEAEKSLVEPLKFNDSPEIDENLLNESQKLDESLHEPLQNSATSIIESASEPSINTKSVDKKLELPTELHSKSSESIVAKTSSSEAMEAKSDESISSNVIDGKTSPVETKTSKIDDATINIPKESENLALETIIEEAKSAESIDVNDVDMEPAVPDKSKEEDMSIDCDDSISFVTANNNDDVSIVSDTKEVDKPLEKNVDDKLVKEKSADDDKKDTPEVSDSATKSKEKRDTFKIKLSNNLDILSDDEEESSKQAEKEASNRLEESQVLNILSDDDEKSCQPVNSTEIVSVKTVSVELSHDLNILSDDDEKSSTPSEVVTLKTVTVEDSQDKTINLDDDDDIMLIDDYSNDKDMSRKKYSDPSFKSIDKNDSPGQHRAKLSIETIDPKNTEGKDPADEVKSESTPEPTSSTAAAGLPSSVMTEKPVGPEPKEKRKPLVPENFFKSYKKNLSDMSRDDLEEFCILKIVESIIDRSTLNETKTKLKAMTQSVEEYKKKALSMFKQQRDLQVVLKSVQEEQKNNSTTPIAPLKITRSVGMQVLMSDKNRRKPANSTVSNQSTSQNTAKQASKHKPKPPAKPPKLPVINTIPVPRLVPASNVAKAQAPNKPTTNGIKTPPVQKPEKRTHSRMTSQSVTVDLTDDEPPAKAVAKSPVQSVRVVPPQNLMTARGQNASNSPRKVFIPISGPGSQPLRPGQTIMVKNMPASGLRQRNPNATIRPPNSATRAQRPTITRHPAPLPAAMKQYQPPNWKALPPAPDLKLSKVENGIVISWKIEGYLEDSYEDIASYQLFAYQETSAPPNTNLWKKIGDVKALPLPMACTLTQFMAGYKYYFAVRAVDIRSRLGPFSMPGSILLLNKM